MNKEQALSFELASALLSYDPDSGVFVWRISRPNAKSGCVAGYIEKTSGYIRIEIVGRWYSAHRLAWLLTYGAWPSDFLDHVNGTRADNRIENLRIASRMTNAQNQRLPSSNNTTGFLGVSKRKGNYHSRPFTAQIRNPETGRMKHLGYFATAEEAHEAYLAKKREIHPGCTI